jgi:PAS domain S-box-containing protein
VYPDEGLAEHLTRIEGYMRGYALLRVPRERSPLRDELATAIEEILPSVVEAWISQYAKTFNLPEEQRQGLSGDIAAALFRWVAHIRDPANYETYDVLRQHASGGFISQFPASRFIAGQMKSFELLSAALRRRYAHDRDKRSQLLSLLAQEFEERVLHVTDFFVEAREEQLREQEATYRRSIDSAPAAILRIDWDTGAVLSANFVAEQHLGYSAAELQQMKVWELHPPEERAAAMQLLTDTIAKGNASRDHLHHRTRTGAVVPMFINAGAIEYGKHRFIQQICVDISDRKRLEDQLIQSEKMAAIGQLAAGIAHEIRNPLAIITNALYDLSEIVDTGDPAVQEDLRIATEEMGRVQAIINSLLEFSRESRAERELVDVNDLLRKTLQLMNKYLQNNAVQVVTDLPELEPCNANENALRQIFLNLITNAVQAMPHGGELRVRTSRAPENRMRLEFSDTGIGIPEHQIKDIFNPFFTTKSAGQGTGLGLSVVHSVVRRYQGAIQVQSTPTVGTTFTIELPCGCEDGGSEAS